MNAKYSRFTMSVFFCMSLVSSSAFARMERENIMQEALNERKAQEALIAQAETNQYRSIKKVEQNDQNAPDATPCVQK